MKSKIVANPYRRFLNRIASSEREMDVLMELHEQQVENYRQSAGSYVEKLFEFICDKLESSTEFRLKPHWFFQFETMFSFCPTSEHAVMGRNAWLQDLLYSGEVCSRELYFEEMNRKLLFSGKSQTFQQIGCEISMLFMPLEEFIDVRLIVLEGEREVRRKSVWDNGSDGKLHRRKRLVSVKYPDRAYLKLTLLKVPKLKG